MSQDEGRAARINKYKEERRKQLIARTATLFSANVTERRPRRAIDRTSSDDPTVHLKSASELNLNSISSSVPIRTTRTSRLRAAATTNSDSSPSPRKSNRSSSVQSLLDEDKVKTPKSSKIIDRDKVKALNRRQSHEKENLKSLSRISFDKDVGANKTKPKHSIAKNILEKDKSNVIVNSPKTNSIEEKKKSKLVEKIADVDVKKTESSLHVNGEEVLNEILNDKSPSSLDKDNFEDLFNDLVVDDAVNNGIEASEDVHDVVKVESGLKNSQNFNIPAIDEVEVKDSVKVDSDLVSISVNDAEVGLLGAVCVRKVERFSELLSNLCSPYEAEQLFEELVDNGTEDSSETRTTPECTAPCRRAQASPRTTSTAKKGQPVAANETGHVKARTRRPIEAPLLKTENSLPSSRVSPKSTYSTFGLKSSPLKHSSFYSPPKHERRPSAESSKPSFIPLSKKTADKHSRNSTSPVKQDLTRDKKN